MSSAHQAFDDARSNGMFIEKTSTTVLGNVRVGRERKREFEALSHDTV
jgi:hypothetical protein